MRDYLDGAQATFVVRAKICLDRRGLPFLVAEVRGELSDGRPFIVCVDERLVGACPNEIEPRLLTLIQSAQGEG